MRIETKSEISIVQLPLGPLQTNCYVVACTTTGQAAVIDPGWDDPRIAQTLTDNGWTLAAIWITHAHFDHVGGLEALRQRYPDVPVAIHPGALDMLAVAARSAQVWGITIDQPAAPETMLAAGQELDLGELSFEVLYTPGHAPGHVCFYAAELGVVFDGDVLFEQSVGRTDLPGGNYDVLMASIRDELLVLPNDTLVLSGHGPATTIGAERRGNPFLQQGR